MITAIYPFTAIVGQDDFKLALLLNVIDSTLGGVLAIGDKGTGKTTLVRSLAALMQGDQQFPFVNLPIGASEESVLGQLNLGKFINEKKEHLQLGLLAKADRGILYIDEVNLLNDYLMDLLLDASSTGAYFLEREGFSRKLNSRFALVGSMNPEEGSLRPQLKDRFGLSVPIKTTTLQPERMKIVQRRLSFDADASTFLEQYQPLQVALYEKITKARALVASIPVESAVLSYCTQLAIEHQVEGLRADILLVKAARAFAALEQASKLTIDHVKRIESFVLNHRSQKTDQPTDSPPSTPPDAPSNHSSEKQENLSYQKMDPKASQTKLKDIIQVGAAHSNGQQSSKNDGFVDKVSASNYKKLDKRKTIGQYLATDDFQVYDSAKQHKKGKHLLFVLDSSGSMLEQEIIAYAKGMLSEWTEQEKGRSLQFSLIVLMENKAEILINNASSPTLLLEKIKEVQTGGKTNILEAFKAIKRLSSQHANAVQQLIIISDGRFLSPTVPSVEQLVMAYQLHCKMIQHLYFIDTETSVVKVGWGKKMTALLNGHYQLLRL